MFTASAYSENLIQILSTMSSITIKSSYILMEINKLE